MRDAAVGIVCTLRGAGHVAYFAGGCVRDSLLGVRPKDYDIATDARPEAVRKLFRRSRYVGEAFGVVLVYAGGGRETEKRSAAASQPTALGKAERRGPEVGWTPGTGFEVATFRTEWGYEDGRRPGGVEFTDAEHDAQRRDFTVNGLFSDPLDENLEPVAAGDERVIDYVGGRADLEARVLRAIGVPAERFGEDYLRMLRAARFAARLGFTIDPATADAVRASAANLSKISRERIGQEVRLMLTGEDPAGAAGLIQELALDGPTLGEAHVDQPLGALGALMDDARSHGKVRVIHPWASVAGDVPYGLALAAWMLDRAGASGSVVDAAGFVKRRGKEVLGRWRKALCLSNGDRDTLVQILELLPRVDDWEGLGVAKRKRLLAAPKWKEAWALARMLGPGHVVQRIEAEAGPLWSQGVAPEPWVTGDDLLGLGIQAGPKIGDLLEAVYDAQLEGRVKSRAEGLDWVKGLG